MIHAGAPDAIQWVTAIAQSLGAVVWPVVILVVVLVFRRPLTDVIQNARHVKIGALELERERVTAETSVSVAESLIEEAPSSRPILRELYASKARENPLHAILTGYSDLERWFDDALRAHDLSPHDGFRKLSVREMAGKMLTWGWITQDNFNQVEGLSVLRDISMHGGAETTTEEATEFLTLTDGALRALDRQIAAYDASH